MEASRNHLGGVAIATPYQIANLERFIKLALERVSPSPMVNGQPDAESLVTTAYLLQALFIVERGLRDQLVERGYFLDESENIVWDADGVRAVVA